MTTDTLYQHFVKRWEEVIDLPVQNIGPMTPLYKRLTKRLKVMPWVPLLIVSFICVVGLWYLTGSAITLLTSLLQRGF